MTDFQKIMAANYTGQEITETYCRAIADHQRAIDAEIEYLAGEAS